MGYYNQPPTAYAQELNDLEKLLRELPLEGAIKGLDLLETLTRKVIQNPSEEKFRRVRITNEKLEPLFGLSGAVEAMSEMGWRLEGEFLVLPRETTLDFPTHIVKILEAKSYYGKKQETAARSAKRQADPKKAELLRQLEIDRRERAAEGASLPIAVNRPAPALEKVPPKREAAPAPISEQAAPEPAEVIPEPAAIPVVPEPAARPEAAPAAGGTHAEGAAPRPKSAFDFESRAKVEAKKQDAEMSLQDLRQLQKNKFQEFQADPNAKSAAAYQRPPSGAPEEEPGWFDWLWGGSSSSSGGGGGGGGGGNRRDPPPGPRMKTINDLPKPARRGGG